MSEGLVESDVLLEPLMSIGLIQSLDHEARGITRLDGKAVFVEGALPGERVEFASFRKKPTFEIAQLVRVLSPSPARVLPKCSHFGICGGCALQHMDPVAQVAAKQRILEDSLWHIGRVRPEYIESPVQGEPWGYRHRARLGVRCVKKPGGILIGFHERKSNFVADIHHCAVLPAHVSELLLPLRKLIATLSNPESVPQLDIAVGEHCTAILLRILHGLKTSDESALRGFADRHQVSFFLQPKGPDSAYLFYPKDGRSLSYVLPEFGLELDFLPTDFTQVNHAVNRVMLHLAMNLLAPRAGERIADMFCGLGNFTLPIARAGANVVGVEGSAALVKRAHANAKANGLSERTGYQVANLFECTEKTLAKFGQFDKMLIDPPRDGALALVRSIGARGPRRIVYVSCNPATLARDAGVLVKEHGYRFVSARAINMFPHTSHVESITLFERPKKRRPMPPLVGLRLA